MEELRILSPTAILGYGFPEESFRRGLAQNPQLIAVDGGSTDPGPYYLGAGVSFTDRAAVKRDLQLMIKAGKERSVPVLVGTAGGAGGRVHLDWCAGIAEEIAGEQGLSLKVALIDAEFSKEEVIENYRQRKLEPLFPAGEITIKDIEDSSRIVGQMGVEPIIQALQEEVDVVLAGRAYDPTVFAASAIKAGFPAGLALHMGKILECASIAADPGSGSDCMLGRLKNDSFILEALNPQRRCTITSVAAHSLYEKSNPLRLSGPGGTIDLSECRFEQLDQRQVKVTGSKFIIAKDYTIKLEGAKMVGYRTISIAGCRDPIMITQIEQIMAGVKGMVKDNFTGLRKEDYRLLFRIYGKNGVMGSLEPVKEFKSHELGIIIEVVAKTQQLANTICSFARSAMLHYGYPGRVATAGNLAFPYSPSDFKAGQVYQFSLHHLLKVEDPLKYFPITFKLYGKGVGR